MTVPVKDDEGLVGKVVRGVIRFEGRTLDDCLLAIEQATRQISSEYTSGTNYSRGEEGEVSFYSFEVEYDEEEPS